MALLLLGCSRDVVKNATRAPDVYATITFWPRPYDGFATVEYEAKWVSSGAFGLVANLVDGTRIELSPGSTWRIVYHK